MAATEPSGEGDPLADIPAATCPFCGGATGIVSDLATCGECGWMDAA
jgi:hypothetical protein